MKENQSHLKTKQKKACLKEKNVRWSISHQIHCPFSLNFHDLLLLSQHVLKMNPGSLDAEMTC